jgi:hypothetical protein
MSVGGMHVLYLLLLDYDLFNIVTDITNRLFLPHWTTLCSNTCPLVVAAQANADHCKEIRR